MKGREFQMEVHTTHIVKRKDGAMVDIHLNPVRSIKSALRFHNIEDYEKFIHGYYGPDNPADYYLQPIKITYEEV